MTELFLVLIFMIIGSIVAIEAKDLLSSVVALGSVGMGLSITLLIVKAPDVAITQIVVEILCLIILIKATIKRDLPFSTSGRWFFNTVIAASFIAVFIFVAAKVLSDLPQFGYPVMKISNIYLKEGLARTGATNVVSSIILDFRAYDTLGEAAVLFTAVMGILAVVRRRGRIKSEKEAVHKDQ